ncbi:MAG: PUA domain-containing protein [Candidatus Bathyarchaeia archaeon]
MAEQIKNFIKLFDSAQINLDWELVARKGNRFFYIPPNLRSLVKKNWYYYAGFPLGKMERGKFLPSFPLLLLIAEKAENRIVVDDKAAWLFVCGRDIFKQGITHVEGSREKGSYTLILNKHGECLGFGRIRQNLDELKRGVAVENVLDIGDFLRREKAPEA